MKELNGYETLLSRIEMKKAEIVVLGQGYVGLPLALSLSKVGYHVTGFDINRRLIEELKRGKTRFSEPGVRTLLIKALSSGRYIPEEREDLALHKKDVYIVAVHTPAKSDGSPELKFLVSALKLIISHVKGKYLPFLLVIESTVPPKTMEEVVLPLFEDQGLFLGEDFFAAYCPERAMPGKLLEELWRGSRVIGVLDELSGKLASALYSSFTEGEIKLTHARTAELVKLVENSYRDVNIAFANSIALACEALGVDVDEVRDLANLHPRVNILKPGIGVGGSCLTKDPYLLLNCALNHGVKLRLIGVARKLNEELPKHAAKLIMEALESLRKDPKETLVAVLGITYKGDVSDYRNSPVLELIRILKEEGYNVRVFDPLVEPPNNLGKVCKSLEEAVKGADCVVIGAEHSIFLKMDLNEIRRLCGGHAIFFDGKHVFSRKSVEEAGFDYLSVGSPLEIIRTSREIAERRIYES